MRVLPSSYNNFKDCAIHGAFEEVMAVVMDYTDDVTDQFNYLLQNGWRCIITIDSSQPNGNLRLDLQEGNGGSFAEVKLHTVNSIISNTGTLRCATGTDNMQFVHELITAHKLCDDEIGREIMKLTAISEITRKQHEWLRGKLDYTTFYGAIKVHYSATKFSPPLEGNYPSSGTIAIAFSGASQEQDLMFAMLIFRELQERLAFAFKRDYFQFHLTELKKVPNARLWLDVLEIQKSCSRKVLSAEQKK